MRWSLSFRKRHAGLQVRPFESSGKPTSVSVCLMGAFRCTLGLRSLISSRSRKAVSSPDVAFPAGAQPDAPRHRSVNLMKRRFPSLPWRSASASEPYTLGEVSETKLDIIPLIGGARRARPFCVTRAAFAHNKIFLQYRWSI